MSEDKKFEHNQAVKSSVVCIYPYHDETGNLAFEKIRYIPKSFSFRHWINGQCIKGIAGIPRLPYRLPAWKDSSSVIVAEGEKDADSLARLGFASTSAPCGVKDWPEEITPWFKDKLVYILYDVGEEEHARNVAVTLYGTARELRICNLGPDHPNEFDITDLLNSIPPEEPDREAKQKTLVQNVLRNAEAYKLDILSNAEREGVEERSAIMEIDAGLERSTAEKSGQHEAESRKGIFIGSFENFVTQEVPPDDPLVQSLVFRGGLTGIGGVKGSHKSFFVNQLAFHFATGWPFLDFGVEKPGRVLLIQQEVSLGFNQERLKRMQLAGNFKVEDRFFPFTTTGKQLKLVKKEDLLQIKNWLREFEPDMLILDPLSSFNLAGEENTSRDMGRIVNVFCELKSEFNIGLTFTHHFSSKQDPNDPGAPTEAGGWFRGHSILPDACDVLICLHRLPGQRQNPSLAKSWEDYNLVQIQLRNGRWPERFAIEFEETTFLLHKSSIWQEIGKKILPGEIEDLIEEHGGEMLKKAVIESLKLKSGLTTIKKAIREALEQGIIDKETLHGKGNPILLRLKK
jgi:hypothetical protein